MNSIAELIEIYRKECQTLRESLPSSFGTYTTADWMRWARADTLDSVIRNLEDLPHDAVRSK